MEQATAAFDAYDYARALNVTESFFWQFTDDYVELLKDRAYGGHGEAEQASVVAALATTLDSLLRLLAPFQPFATEEVWSWWRTGSVHRAPWPGLEAEAAGLRAAAEGGDPQVLAVVAQVLGRVRKAKSEAKVKQRTQVRTATVRAAAAQLDALRGGLADLKGAGNVADVTLTEADGELEVTDIELAPAEEA